jgi:Tfp pilus assembly pilus retraction ATPase PilT
MTTKTNIALCVIVLLALSTCAAQRTIENMKAEADAAQGGRQAALYAQLAEVLVSVAGQQFNRDDDQGGQATVQDVLKYATRARDLTLYYRDKMKETEITLRSTQRKLESLKRTLGVDDRPPVEKVEKQLQQFRQEILDAMFAPPKKEKKK